MAAGNEVNRRTVLGASAAGLAALSAGAAEARQAGGQHHGRVAFVTGGARGIGLATALALAGEGADIVLFDVAGPIEGVSYRLATPQDLLQAKAAVEETGVRCLAIQGDVRRSADLASAMAQVEKAFGRLDIVVANAAVVVFGDLDANSDEELMVMSSVNLVGVAQTLRAATPLLKRGSWGRIVTLSSTAGRGGAPQFAFYSGTKWGVIGLTKSAAFALGSSGITCNAVCPTLVRTAMVDNDYLKRSMSPQNPSLEAISGYFRTLHPLPIDILEPSAIADTIKFLCSEQASHISGAVIDASAGFSARSTA